MNCKKTLAAISAAVMSMTLIPLPTYAVETADYLNDPTISECIDYVNEMSSIDEQNAPDVGVFADIISEEECEVIEKVLENDYEGNGWDDYIYKSQKYDFSSEYYYNQLSSDMKQAYDQLDAACTAFLPKTNNLSTQFFAFVTLDTPLATQSEACQVFWCFYYSNPQYFFLKNSLKLGQSDGKINKIYLSVSDDCKVGANRTSFQSTIDSITEEYINSVSSISGDAAKETAIANILSDNIEYASGSNDQSLVGALCDGKCVCNGYAMAMNYFCNALGIECITVTSSKHAWNRVKLDGKWYEADVTKYDQGTDYLQEWLNKSTATFQANDSDELHVVETEADMYTNITLPSCTDDLSSGREYTITLKYMDGITADETLTTDAETGKLESLPTPTRDGYTFKGWFTAETDGIPVTTESVFEAEATIYAQWTKNAVAPKAPTITVTDSKDGVVIKWNAIDDATSYIVYRADSATGTKTKLKLTSYTSFTDSTAVAGKTYYYWVVSYNSAISKSSVYSNTANILFTGLKLVAPGFGSKSVTPSGVVITWKPVSTATSYRIYRSETYSGTKNLIKVTGYTSFCDANVAYGKSYYYWVEAYNSKTKETSPLSKQYYVAVPKIPAAPGFIERYATDNGAFLKWSAVDGATSYIVYRSETYSGTKTKIKLTGNTSYCDTTAAKGKSYYYWVVAYNSNIGKSSAYSRQAYVTMGN